MATEGMALQALSPEEALAMGSQLHTLAVATGKLHIGRCLNCGRLPLHSMPKH
jgi:hypothetical protein